MNNTNLSNLKEIAATLSDSYKTNAESLISRMEEVIEGIGDEPIRWKPSILKLVQGTTDRSNIPKGTGIGDFVLGEAKLEKPLAFIPLRLMEGRQYWSPDKDEAKMICSSPDGKLGYIGNYCAQCPHAKFDEVARKSECGKTQTLMAIMPDLSDIFLVTFSKTGYKVGLELKTIMSRAAVPLFKRVYSLDSETNKEHKNVENYCVNVLDADKRNTNVEIVPFLQELFNLITVDRKASVDKFHELTLARKQQRVIEAPKSENVVMLEDSSSEENPVSDLAKNYQV